MTSRFAFTHIRVFFQLRFHCKQCNTQDHKIPKPFSAISQGERNFSWGVIMAYYKLFFALIIAVLIGEHVARCEGSWSKVLYLILQARHGVITEMTNGKNTNFQNQMHLRDLRQVLDKLPAEIEEFARGKYANSEAKRELLKNLPQMLREVEMPKLRNLFVNAKMARRYQRRLGKKLPKIKDSIERFLQSSGPQDRYQLPLDAICPRNPKRYQTMTKMSVNAICINVNECSRRRGHGNSPSDTDISTACTRDNKCNLEKALPMMAGIFWYMMSDVILQGVCFRQCSLYARPKCIFYANVKRLQHEAILMKAYLFSLPQYFNHALDANFFQQAVQKRGFSNLDVALSMIQEKRDDFQITSTMCDEIKFTKACSYSDIYKQFVFIKKVQNHRINPGIVKDLRMKSKVDHAKMVQLQKDTANHIQLLGSIQRLNRNLEASVTGISSYFSTLAKYDEGIAIEDVAFIQSQLTKFENATAHLENKLKQDFFEGMTLMEKTAKANFLEQTGILAVRVAENCNPLRIIFGGSEPGEIYEQATKVADATPVVFKASALFLALNKLAMDSAQIGKAFFGGNSNKNQLSNLKALVDKIRKNKVNDIGADGSTFVREYASYTPQTDRSKLAYNNGLWSAYKDAMCDILNGEVGILGVIPRYVEGGMLQCEKLEGTLAQFFTIREEIYEFQFELVDALTKVVRGNMAKRLTQNIRGKGDVLPATELMLGFLMTENRIQTHSSLYCDKLEYRQLGKPVKACSTLNGLFSKDNVNALCSYTDHGRYDEFERDVYIPTKSSFPGDTGYIDLDSLGKGESVIFKIPANETWLQEYRWTLKGETTIPFVERFKIFFPHSEYKTGAQQELTVPQVTITSIAGSAVSTVAPNTSPVYVLPREHSTFVTVYEEGYSSCTPPNEINNPYSLCKNLPKLCIKSIRQAGQSLLPTILSTWKLKFEILQGTKVLKWDAPKSKTNLLIRAKLKLRMLPRTKKRSHVPQPSMKDNDVTMSENGCCDTGNRYRNTMYSRTCKTCPQNTTSKLRGLYCEINDKA